MDEHEARMAILPWVQKQSIFRRAWGSPLVSDNEAVEELLDALFPNRWEEKRKPHG